MESTLGSQFVWWMGVVESRQDPKKIGRCRVRIVGSHTESKSQIPTNDLPWAQPLLPVNDSASLIIKEGDYVVGFYLDGENGQTPIIMGILPGVPTTRAAANEGFSDPRTGSELSSAPKKPGASATRNPINLNESTLSRLARNEKISDTAIQTKKNSAQKSVTVAGGGSWSEPVTPYAAKYPYNRVMETESGHIIEFDDTPGAERVHIYHRSGTFDEYHPDGSKVTHIKSKGYEIVLSDKDVYIGGDCNITTAGSVNIKAGKNINLEAGADVIIRAGGSFKSTSGASQEHTAGAGINLKGVPINLN